MLLLSTVSNVKERHLPGRGPSGWCGLISYWLNLRHTGRSSSSDPRSTGGRGTAPSNTELKLPENYLSCNQLTLSRLVHPLYRLDMASPGCVESCTFALRLDFLHTLRLQIPPPPHPHPQLYQILLTLTSQTRSVSVSVPSNAGSCSTQPTVHLCSLLKNKGSFVPCHHCTVDE